MTGGARRCRRGAARHSKEGTMMHRPLFGTSCALLARWSGRPDSNWRPPAPHAGALPGCATPRPDNHRISHPAAGCNSVARRYFRHAPAPDFWPRRGRKRGNAGESRSAHTCFVYPVVARANRFNRPRYSECNPALQPRVSVRQLPLPYRIRSAGSGKIQPKLCHQRALKIPPAPIR